MKRDAGESTPTPASWPNHGVSFKEAVRTWASIGLLSFGGPAAQIAVMHRVIVDEKRWIGERRFLDALNFCMLLPGPEAMQLATYIGWLMHRTRGALVAGLLFILPGFVSIMALSVIYGMYHGQWWLSAAFYGIKPAVLVIVVQAVIRIGKRALLSRAMVATACASFLALFAFGVPFPIVVVGALLVGFVGAMRWPSAFKPARKHGAASVPEAGVLPLLADDAALPVSRSPVRAVRVLLLWLAIWFTPLLVAVWACGPRSTVSESGLFFAKAATVTFGGAYAVLGYVAQHAPQVGWLTPGEMVDGLGMAETTPGPLIMVLQFVGYMACFRHPISPDEGSIIALSPLWSGVVGASLATWMTFAPCFMWIFIGAPYMERLRHDRRLGAALASVTAAVVGVVLALAVWFATSTLFHASPRRVNAGPVRMLVPEWSSLDVWSVLLALVAAYMTFKWKWGIARVVCVSLILGMLVQFALVWVHWNPD